MVCTTVALDARPLPEPRRVAMTSQLRQCGTKKSAWTFHRVIDVFRWFRLIRKSAELMRIVCEVSR